MEFDDLNQHVTCSKRVPTLERFAAFKRNIFSDSAASVIFNESADQNIDSNKVTKFHRAAELNGLSADWNKLDVKLNQMLSQIKGTSLEEKLLHRRICGSK